MNIVSMKFNVIDWALETVSLIVASLIYNRKGKIYKLQLSSLTLQMGSSPLHDDQLLWNTPSVFHGY